MGIVGTPTYIEYHTPSCLQITGNYQYRKSITSADIGKLGQVIKPRDELALSESSLAGASGIPRCEIGNSEGVAF